MPSNAKSIIMVSYNGQQMQLGKQAKRVDDRVLIPLRDLSESLAYRVSWDGKKKEIEITERGVNIRLVIDSDTAQVNGAEVKLDVGAQIQEGTTYVPLRFVGEAFNMSVDWDSKSQSVNLESKYSLDEESKQLLVRTKEGRKPLTKINTLYEDSDRIYMDYHSTKNGNDIVTVNQIIQGAAGTGTSSTTLYIKDGVIIDKVEKPFNFENNYGLIEQEDFIAFNHGDHLKVYDDKTGSLIKSYDLNDFQEGLTLDLMKMNTYYIMGRHKSTIHVIDLETGKVTRILDLIPEVDQYYVFESDMYLSTDKIDLVQETDTELVFKYYSVSERTEKTVTCKLGK